MVVEGDSVQEHLVCLCYELGHVSSNGLGKRSPPEFGATQHIISPFMEFYPFREVD